MSTPWPGVQSGFTLVGGALTIVCRWQWPPEWLEGFDADFGFNSPHFAYWQLPEIRYLLDDDGFEATTLVIPLWLLAVICLAWPVTSFILARRRHKRGFPVEPKGDGEGAVSTPLPRAGDVPSESAREAERV